MPKRAAWLRMFYNFRQANYFVGESAESVLELKKKFAVK
jgi:hypothetical protein